MMFMCTFNVSEDDTIWKNAFEEPKYFQGSKGTAGKNLKTMKNRYSKW